MTRLFGTDGIRGVANVDLRPSLAFALGRATAHQVVRRGRLAGRRAATPGARATCSWPRSPPARRAWAPTCTRSGSCPTPALAFLAADGDFAAGIMVSASHNPAEDNGLKVLDPRGLKLDDDVEDELEAAVLRADELPGVAPGSIGRTVDARPAPRALRRPSPRARGGPSTRAACTSCWTRPTGRRTAWRPRSCARPGATGDRDPRRPRRRQHQPGERRDGAGLAGRRRQGRRRRHRVRARRGRGPVRRGGPGGQPRRRRPGPRHPRARAAGARRARPRQPRGVGALERRPPGGGRGGGWPHRADPGRRQAHPRGDAGLGRRPRRREERARDHPRAHDVGRRDRDRDRAAAGHDDAASPGSRELATAVPLLPQQQRAIRVRHRDQWEADDVLGASIADAERRLAPHGRVLVRPSGTEPVLRVMVEGPDAALVSELADAIATLAGDRLH